MDKIHFFAEDVDFKLEDPNQTADWINHVIDNENLSLIELSYIFCSDEYLHEINMQYLDHDTYTDIITFDNSDEPGLIEGDIFISIPRVKENSQQLGVPFNEELHRVLVHGVLHLMGYTDHTEEEKSQMRKKEEACLSLRLE